jgi:hypothetical protein
MSFLRLIIQTAGLKTKDALFTDAVKLHDYREESSMRDAIINIEYLIKNQFSEYI